MRILIGLALITVGCKDKKTDAPATVGSAVTEPTQAAKLPGTCVDVVADAAERAATAGGIEGEPPYDEPGVPDLDGDGTPDRMFAVSGGGMNVATYVYVMRGSCGHYVGDIGSKPEPVSTAERHYGLVDLRIVETAACEGAPCGCDPGESWFRFDGSAYQLDKAASKASTERECDEK